MPDVFTNAVSDSESSTSRSQCATSRVFANASRFSAGSAPSFSSPEYR